MENKKYNTITSISSYCIEERSKLYEIFTTTIACIAGASLMGLLYSGTVENEKSQKKIYNYYSNQAYSEYFSKPYSEKFNRDVIETCSDAKISITDLSPFFPIDMDKGARTFYKNFSCGENPTIRRKKLQEIFILENEFEKFFEKRK